MSPQLWIILYTIKITGQTRKADRHPAVSLQVPCSTWFNQCCTESIIQLM